MAEKLLKKPQWPKTLVQVLLTDSCFTAITLHREHLQHLQPLFKCLILYIRLMDILHNLHVIIFSCCVNNFII